jgi:DNA invertase Pin-like site-specific DNA recombinase
MLTHIYSRQTFGQNGNQAERLADLRQTIEAHGDTVVASFTDDPTITGKGKFKGWRSLLDRLTEADQVIVISAADLPGRKVHDLFKVLADFRNNGVSLYAYREGIDTGNGSAAIIDLINAFRAAKLSEAIKAGICKAKERGKILGRPAIPDRIRRRVLADLAGGAGIRPTARRHNVSPATVINIRRATGRDACTTASELGIAAEAQPSFDELVDEFAAAFDAWETMANMSDASPIAEFDGLPTSASRTL